MRTPMRGSSRSDQASAAFISPKVSSIVTARSTPIAAATLGTPSPAGISKPVRRSRSRLPAGGASTVTTIASKPESTASSTSAPVTASSRKQ